PRTTTSTPKRGDWLLLSKNVPVTEAARADVGSASSARTARRRSGRTEVSSRGRGAGGRARTARFASTIGVAGPRVESRLPPGRRRDCHGTLDCSWIVADPAPAPREDL